MCGCINYSGTLERCVYMYVPHDPHPDLCVGNVFILGQKRSILLSINKTIGNGQCVWYIKAMY